MFELTKLEEKKLERNLVWVFASARSGTSWITTELLSHNTKRWPEPMIGFHIAGEIGPNSPQFRMIDRSERENYFFCDHFKSIWIYYLKKLILYRIHVQFNELSRKIIIKEPNGSQGADILLQCFPNSKFILLLRDGRDIIHSMITQISEGGYSIKKRLQGPLLPKKRFASIKLRSQRWVRLMDVLLNAYNQHDEKLRYMMKYENLRSDTFNELKKLYEFIEVKITDDELKKIIKKFSFENLPEDEKGIGTQRQFAKIGIWKEKFNPKEIQLMEEIMGNTLKKLGYT